MIRFIQISTSIFIMAVFTACASKKASENSYVKISGELKQWHKVTVNLVGPFAEENDSIINPFTDYKMTVTFTHESGSPVYKIPGYFAADGNAAHTSATKGNTWRAHLSPDKTGRWTYSINFLKAKNIAIAENVNAQQLEPFHNLSGSFHISATDKSGKDLRAKGRLTYVNGHYLQWAGSKQYFLKAGADAPETLLAYQDFDNTIALKPKVPLKTFPLHVKDWKEGDPTWQNGKGKGLIGGINYLSSKGINSFSFLTYNAGGDGDNVWPFVNRDDKLRYDCSKLDQWQIVLDHAQKIGMHLHFKLQENESDDNREGKIRNPKQIKEAMDGGATGPERKLYLREIIARFGYELALNWNLGEENTQSYEEQSDMANYIKSLDPYHHPIVIHTYPDQQDRVYPQLLGNKSVLTGASLQNKYSDVHHLTLKWRKASAEVGKPWVVANDEQGPAASGVPQDIGYRGTDGIANFNNLKYDLNDIRKYTLWGNLMAGGAGVEYYFGYKLPENDLIAEDFRSRDQSWEYCDIALNFFKDYKIPFWEMKNANELIGNPSNSNDKYCFAKADEIYLVYLPNGGNSDIDLTDATGEFNIQWFNPRNGTLQADKVISVKAGDQVNTGNPPVDITNDWLVMLRKK